MKNDKTTILFSGTADTPENITMPSRRTALRSLSLAAAALGLAIGAQPGSAATKKIKMTKNSSQKTTKGERATGSKSSDDYHLKRSKN